MNLINITPGAATQFDVDLAGRRYTLRFTYNARGAYWTVDLSLGSVALVTGMAAVMGVELFRGHADPLIPRALFLVPLDKDTTDADYDELGDRVKLIQLETTDDSYVAAMAV